MRGGTLFVKGKAKKRSFWEVEGDVRSEYERLSLVRAAK
jgi:hypothetical protein